MTFTPSQQSGRELLKKDYGLNPEEADWNAANLTIERLANKIAGLAISGVCPIGPVMDRTKLEALIVEAFKAERRRATPTGEDSSK
jgi:hypothetical protein